MKLLLSGRALTRAGRIQRAIKIRILPMVMLLLLLWYGTTINRWRAEKEKDKKKKWKGLVVFQWLWWVQLSSGSNGITCVSDKILRLLGHFFHLNDINQAREREREREVMRCVWSFSWRENRIPSLLVNRDRDIYNYDCDPDIYVHLLGQLLRQNLTNIKGKIKKTKKKRSSWWKCLLSTVISLQSGKSRSGIPGQSEVNSFGNLNKFQFGQSWACRIHHLLNTWSAF